MSTLQQSRVVKMQSSQIFDRSRMLRHQMQEQELTELDKRVNRLASSAYSEEQSYTQIDKNTINNYFQKQQQLLAVIVSSIQEMKLIMDQHYQLETKKAKQRNNRDHICEENVAFLKKILREAGLLQEQDQHQYCGAQELLEITKQNYFKCQAKTQKYSGQYKLKSSIEQELSMINQTELKQQLAKIPKVLSLDSNVVASEQTLQNIENQVEHVYLTPPCGKNDKSRHDSGRVHSQDRKLYRKGQEGFFHEYGNHKKFKISNNRELFIRQKHQLEEKNQPIDSLYKRLNEQHQGELLNYSNSQIVHLEEQQQNKIQESLVLQSLIQDRLAALSNTKEQKEQEKARLKILQQMVSSNQQPINIKDIDKKQLEYSQILCQMMKKYISIMEKPINKPIEVTFSDMKSSEKSFQQTAKWHCESIILERQSIQNKHNPSLQVYNYSIRTPKQHANRYNKKVNSDQIQQQQQVQKENISNKNARIENQNAGRDKKKGVLSFKKPQPKKKNNIRYMKKQEQSCNLEDNTDANRVQKKISLIQRPIYKKLSQKSGLQHHIIQVIDVKMDQILVYLEDKTIVLINFSCIDPQNIIKVQYSLCRLHLRLISNYSYNKQILKFQNSGQIHKFLHNMQAYHRRLIKNMKVVDVYRKQ